jgi:hypothetical protein
MGSMSASDAAPLPRLGEVFFDVRGDSRSMRLSWYADTGVAVFSIWQGGTCTGTFRLPIDDLTRMVEALRRGPQGPRARRDVSRGQGAAEPPYGRDLGPGPLAGPGDGPDPGPSTVAMRPLPGTDPRTAASRADAGYPGEPGGYDDERAGYGEHTGFHENPAGYDDESAGYHNEAAGYPGEPPRGYRDGPPAGDYRSVPSPAYRDDPLTGDYPSGDYPSGDYPGGDYPSSGYAEEPATGDYRSVPSPAYRDDPLTGDYRGASAGYRDDRADYPGEPPLHDYRDAAGTHHAGPAGDYHDGVADDYSDDSSGYPAEPLYPGYPGEPPFRDYSHKSVIGDYPGEPAERDLEPPPAPGAYADPSREWEDTDAGPLGGYSEDPSPESFPYGRPPGNRRSRDRGRYPGRH